MWSALFWGRCILCSHKAAVCFVPFAFSFAFEAGKGQRRNLKALMVVFNAAKRSC